MMRNSILFALLALTATFASGSPVSYYYGSNHTADMDFLHKQKVIYQIFSYMPQVLYDTDYYEIGSKYDIFNSIEYYNNPDYFMEFKYYYQAGWYLHHDALFSYYNEDHLYEMILLYHLFYSAKDFTTFYKTACWARIYMNPGLFVGAFTTAVFYRSDTHYIKLPPIYEIYPYAFFDSKVMKDAYYYKMIHGCSSSYYPVGHVGYEMPSSYPVSNSEMSHYNYYVYANYSYNYYYHPQYNYESKLSYFTEDVGLNAFYYYFRMSYPFWIDLKYYDLPKHFRGDYYYFMHKQIMSRYYLERYSHGFGEIEYFGWDHMNLPGFYNDYSYHTGVSMPRRDWWNVVPYYKSKYVEKIELYEKRIFEAIDSGFFYDYMGNHVSLYSGEGINYLANLIEGNNGSYNLQYYGSYDSLARYIFGSNYYYTNKNYYIPGSLELFTTSLKDPAFYRLYEKILYFFQKYKSHLPYYSKNELEFSGVSFSKVEIDKLVTYFDYKKYYINHGVHVNSYKEGESFSIYAWQQYLNYKPFSYKFYVNSEYDTKGIMHIFLGPAYDGKYFDDYYAYFSKYYSYFFELDQFEVVLKHGENYIERKSVDSPFFYNYNYLGSEFYNYILKSIEGNEPYSYGDFYYGFPSNLMLPMGSFEGMKYQMFFYISPYEEGKIYDMPYYGKIKLYSQSFGFPLDRPVNPWFFQLSNLYFKDVYIYNSTYYDPSFSSYSSYGHY